MQKLNWTDSCNIVFRLSRLLDFCSLLLLVRSGQLTGQTCHVTSRPSLCWPDSSWFCGYRRFWLVLAGSGGMSPGLAGWSRTRVNMLEAQRPESSSTEVCVIPENQHCGPVPDIQRAQLAPGGSLLGCLGPRGRLVVWDPADREAPPAVEEENHTEWVRQEELTAAFLVSELCLRAGSGLPYHRTHLISDINETKVGKRHKEWN